MRRILSTRMLALFAAACALSGADAAAQGTAAQREACAPDAIRLCQDTIPDVARTTVCMRSHESELSPRCEAAFVAATGGSRPVRHVAAVPRPQVHVARREMRRRPRAYAHLHAPRHGVSQRHFAQANRDPDVVQAHRVIGRLCAERVLGSDTCAFTASVLRLAD